LFWQLFEQLCGLAPNVLLQMACMALSQQEVLPQLWLKVEKSHLVI